MVEKTEVKADNIINPEGMSRGSHNGDNNTDKYNKEGPSGKPVYSDEKDRDAAVERDGRKFRSRSPSGDSRGRKASPFRESMHSRSRSGSPKGSYKARGRHSRSRSAEGGRDANKRAYSPDADAPYTQIYVSGITRNCREDDIRRAFAEFGAIRDIVMKPRYAFIDFKYPQDAAVAVTKMNGQMLRDLNIHVKVERSSKFLFL